MALLKLSIIVSIELAIPRNFDTTLGYLIGHIRPLFHSSSNVTVSVGDQFHRPQYRIKKLIGRVGYTDAIPRKTHAIVHSGDDLGCIGLQIFDNDILERTKAFRQRSESSKPPWWPSGWRHWLPLQPPRLPERRRTAAGHSRSLVKLHGCELTLHSDFSFSLSAAEVSRHKISPTANHLSMRPTGSSSTERQSNPTANSLLQKIRGREQYALWIQVQVVDDESTNKILMIQQLEGYSVEQASSGPEPLAAIKRRKPDLILLDLMMPGMRGCETCKVIRNFNNQAELPIVIVTARNHLEFLTQGFQTGVNDFPSKLFYVEELLARVSSQLKFVELHRVDRDNARLKDQIAGYIKADQQLRAANTEVANAV
jgi:CheY-like chemotaxis protein